MFGKSFRGNVEASRLVLLQPGRGELSLRDGTPHETPQTLSHSQSGAELWITQTHADLPALQSQRARHVPLSLGRIH
jgi:hypothetical protein